VEQSAQQGIADAGDTPKPQPRKSFDGFKV
jgi:hypothetical protein